MFFGSYFKRFTILSLYFSPDYNRLFIATAVSVEGARYALVNPIHSHLLVNRGYQIEEIACWYLWFKFFLKSEVDHGMSFNVGLANTKQRGCANIYLS